MNRRDFLRAASAAAGTAFLAATTRDARAAEPVTGKAQVAISLDLEMARNFPTWETTHWDYEKGNLNDEAKAYAVEAAKRVKAAGGVVHFFLVGRALEQANVDWLKELVAAGHKIGNHSYDHVNLLAKTPDDVQVRFKRCPWLVEGRQPLEIIRENIRLCSAAIKSRLGVEPAGFRTPGGFADGLVGREDLQKMLKELGFTWVSGKYPQHKVGDVGKAPAKDVIDDIVRAQQTAQPFRYPTGLLEIPMAPISDIGAFRNGRWPLDSFLQTIRAGVTWAIDNRKVFDFLAHPACLYVTDPKFQAIDLICELVNAARDHAELVDLDAVAARFAKS
jgi:peptidoglycan/xylan/chitin deacetylase (PgdA/CDA1 family)